MLRWAAAPLDRSQITIYAPTLDDSLAADHPVRLFDEVLRRLDFADWQRMYVLVAGQPPIHPRVMAAGILYGLSLGIRSSRKLEDACGNRLDFIWLMEGRKPDHATFCKFRTQFGRQLKDLFRQIGRIGIELGLITLNQVTLDGTDTHANNSRYQTRRRASLEQKLALLDQQVEQAMTQAQQQDQAEDQLYDADKSPAKLPRELKELKRRQEKLQQAMTKLEQLEQERAGRSDLSPKGPAVPLTDPDSRVLPNKGGGHAPNYTSVLAVDSASGMILDTQVMGGNNEASTVLPAVQHIEENFGKKPQQVAADSGFNTGANLADLQAQGVEPLMPAKQEFKENPALRADASQPVAAEQHEALPMNPQNKVLDKAAFIYDQTQDRYFCPMGKPLDYTENKPYQREGGVKGKYRIYQCADCAGCPLAGRCLPKQVKARRVCRDEYESYREQMARRMKSDEGRQQYRRRSHAAETPFAVLKARMGFRQFLLRGLQKVQQELCWVATAYNVVKLIRLQASAALARATAMPAS